jgi:hypothetical protein
MGLDEAPAIISTPVGSKPLAHTRADIGLRRLRPPPNRTAAEVPAAQLPDDVLVYTLRSRYCLPDVLGDEA